MRKIVYISSAITRGDADYNLYVGNATESRLLKSGWSVINPMRSMLALQAQREMSYEQWLDNDFALIARSDLLLRVGGESQGATREMDHARSVGVPVVLSGFFPALHSLFPERRECLPQDESLLAGCRFRPLDDRLRADVAEGVALV